MDTGEFNKYFGAVMGTALFAVALNMGAHALYSPSEHHVASHDQPHKGADVAKKPAADDHDAKIVLTALAGLATGKTDKAIIAKGEKTAKKCHSCHTFNKGGKKKVGPNLYGIVGRKIASIDGFDYSATLKDMGGSWTYEKLNCFLDNPKKCAKGTKMTFSGVKKPEERAALIAWLRTMAPTPAALPTSADIEHATTHTAAAKPAAQPAVSTTHKAAKPATTPATAKASAATTNAQPVIKPVALPTGGDIKKGMKLAKKCASCHSFNKGGKNKVGPNLYGIFGHRIGAHKGYAYSKAFKAQTGVWTAERLDAFLTKPKKYIKGTKMTFAGLRKAKQRQDIIAYLASLSDQKQAGK